MSKPQIDSEPKPPFPKQKLKKPGLDADMKERPRYQASRRVVWTPLNLADTGNPAEKVATFGEKSRRSRKSWRPRLCSSRPTPTRVTSPARSSP